MWSNPNYQWFSNYAVHTSQNCKTCNTGSLINLLCAEHVKSSTVTAEPQKINWQIKKYGFLYPPELKNQSDHNRFYRQTSGQWLQFIQPMLSNILRLAFRCLSSAWKVRTTALRPTIKSHHCRRVGLPLTFPSDLILNGLTDGQFTGSLTNLSQVSTWKAIGHLG